MLATAPIRTSPIQAMNQMLPDFFFLLAMARGNRRMGNKMNAAAVLGKVSVKTTVI
jgi:hypothetical protein